MGLGSGWKFVHPANTPTPVWGTPGIWVLDSCLRSAYSKSILPHDTTASQVEHAHASSHCLLVYASSLSPVALPSLPCSCIFFSPCQDPMPKIHAEDTQITYHCHLKPANDNACPPLSPCSFVLNISAFFFSYFFHITNKQNEYSDYIAMWDYCWLHSFILFSLLYSQIICGILVLIALAPTYKNHCLTLLKGRQLQPIFPISLMCALLSFCLIDSKLAMLLSPLKSFVNPYVSSFYQRLTSLLDCSTIKCTHRQSCN